MVAILWFLSSLYPWSGCLWALARVALRQSPQNELHIIITLAGYVSHPPCYCGQPKSSSYESHVAVGRDVRCIATADKVAEMEALFAKKQVSAGLTPADLLALLLTNNRSAHSDFRPPRFLRTKRDRAAVRPEDMGAAANYSWGTPLDPWEIGWNAQRFTEERLSLQAVRRAFRYCDCAVIHHAGRTDKPHVEPRASRAAEEGRG